MQAYDLPSALLFIADPEPVWPDDEPPLCEHCNHYHEPNDRCEDEFAPKEIP